jgi:hypothetical protein
VKEKLNKLAADIDRAIDYGDVEALNTHLETIESIIECDHSI